MRLLQKPTNQVPIKSLRHHRYCYDRLVLHIKLTSTWENILITLEDEEEEEELSPEGISKPT